MAPATTTGGVAPVALAKTVTVFGAVGPVRLDDVPAGRFHDQLARLAGPARQKALNELGRLRVPFNDVGSITVDDAGALYYECAPPEALLARGATADIPGVTQGSSVPAATPPVRHSRPGSPNIIYLDFNGHTITSTAWNNSKGVPGDAGYRPAVTAYVAKGFDLDGDPTTFNEAEQTFIDLVWKRVAEDYAGFDVDVTTEEPAVFTPTTGRALITSSVDANGVSLPSPTAGGVAYLSRFGANDYALTYSPALIYYNNLQSTESYVAEAVSHEMGHNLSLSHDGTATSEYYQGHGSGETSWAPIMGAAYYVNVSQWSKGEYYNSNNPQDDLALIAGHLGYAADDHGNTKETATPLTVSGASLAGQGIIGAPGDADWFAVTATNQAVQFQATPFRLYDGTYGGNLDIRLELYDSAGTLVAQAAVETATTTSLLEAGLVAGTYYLKVTGKGTGLPQANPPSGYTAYASLGQYTLTGSLSDPVAPVISSQPVGASCQAGQAASFYVHTSAGNPAPSFRWQRLPAGGSTWVDLADDANNLATGTSNFQVRIATVDLSSDQYRCRVYNMAGEAISLPALLTVSPALAPQIYNMPVFRPVNYGDSLSLYPSISGTSPMTYVWKKDGVVLAGATSSSFYKSNLMGADSGVYTLTATNLGGSTVSAGTSVAVNPPVAPAIYNMPQAAAQLYGGTLSLSPTVTGSGPLTYEWRKDGVTLPGATTSYYSRGNLTPADGGAYTLTVTNAWGTATSNPTNLTVAPAVAPTIFGLPVTVSLSYGGYLSLNPTITGSSPLTYQWMKDGVAIAGATSYYLYKGGMIVADSGVYSLTVTNALGSVTSAGIIVNVDAAQPPVIYNLPASATVNYGDYVSLSPSVSGTSPLTYVWKKDGVVLAGATSNYFSRSNLTTADSGNYTLTVSNVAGTTTSPGVAVTVRAPTAPVVYGLPATVAVAYGQSLNLYASVLGTGPVNYQWKKDDVALPGNNSTSFSQYTVTAEDAGNYTLTATNAWGTFTSAAVRVLVDAAVPPAIYGLPTTVRGAYGGSVYLSAKITGTPLLTYLWKKNGQVIAGQTSNQLDLYALTLTDAGSYTLTATNA